MIQSTHFPPDKCWPNNPICTLYIQAPLPFCLDTLPILLSIQGQGSGRQGPPPLAPPEEPANDRA